MKQLASDNRTGVVARRSVRGRHRQLLRTHWLPLLGLGAAVFAVFLVAALFANGPLQRGIILGGGTTLAICMVVASVVLLSGTAPLMMGGIAEQWTAQELRPAQAYGWRLVNHFGLGWGDHDHVLVGPGGVVLVESKWGGTPWNLDRPDGWLQSALSQTAANAQQLSLWHGVRPHGGPSVEPVLVVWGPAAEELSKRPPQRHESGVLVMSGQELQRWLLRQGRAGLTDAQVDAIWTEVTKHAQRRDAHEAAANPMPRSIPQMVQAVAFGMALAVGLFVVAAQLTTILNSVVPWVGIGIASLVAARVLSRLDRLRWTARAFQVGLAALYLLTFATFARDLLVGL